MAVSEEQQLRIALYRKEASKYKEGRPYALNDEQFKKLLELFYVEMEENGFYVRVEDAIKYNGYYFVDFQRQISESVLRAVFQKKQSTINISIVRQAGKTSIVVAIISFCYKHFFEAFGEPFKVAIAAPTKATSGEVFSRLCRFLLVQDNEYAVDRADYKESLRGDSVELFGLNEGGGIREGRSINLLVRDEAAAGSDEIYQDQLVPSLLRTGGCQVLIGNGSFGKCNFYESIKRGDCDLKDSNGNIVGYNKVFRFTYNVLKPYMEGLADMGIQSSRTWVNGVEKYILEHGGLDSLYVRKNIFCEFITAFSNFIDESHFNNCVKDFSLDAKIGKKGERDLYLATDWAYSGDRTIAFFLNKHRVVEDIFIAKDTNQTLTVREQCEKIRDYSDEMGYTERLMAIGGDNTGLGLGAIEFLEIEFGVEVLKVTFTSPWKHENYLICRDLLTTDKDNDRIWFPRDLNNIGILKKELCDLEIHPMNNGYLSFHAPEKEGFFDDIVSALVIAVYMLVNEFNMYNNLGGVKKRFRNEQEEVDYKRELITHAENLREKFIGNYKSSRIGNSDNASIY